MSPGAGATETVARARWSLIAPRVDGRLDEAAWATAAPITTFVQRDPDEGAAPSERTEARILYTDEGLYLGIRAFDTQVDQIAAPLARRDELPPSDWVGVLIDSYYDRRSAFEFVVNPAGVKRDVYHYNDGESDATWDAVWDAATTRDGEGWTAELRIPFSQLRFSGAADRRFGFNLWRQISRRNELQYWQLLPRGGRGTVSRFGVLTGLDSLTARRRVEVIPYTLASAALQPGTPGNPFDPARTTRAALGGDLRLGLSSSLTLTAAVNPDFGQVEADPAVVNLTTTETFLPERRPFFVEGADAFRVPLTGNSTANDQLFYTRRIGRSPQVAADTRGGYAERPGETTILGAAKLMGKTADGWTIGVLGAVTAEETADVWDSAGSPHRDVVEPRAQYAVGRIARDFDGGRTVVGFAGTGMHRDLPAELDHLRRGAWTGGFDLTHRFGGDTHVLRAAAFASHVTGSPTAITATQLSSVHYFQRPDITYASVDPSRTTMTGTSAYLRVEKAAGDWVWLAQGSLSSPDFEVNDLGFIGRAGDRDYRLMLGRRWHTPSRLFRTASLNAGSSGRWTAGGERLWQGLDLWGDMTFHNYWSVSASGWVGRSELQPSALRGGPAIARSGNYFTEGEVRSDPRRSLRLSLRGERWERYEHTDGGYVLQADLGWRPSSRLDLSMGPMLQGRRNDHQYLGTTQVAGAPEYVVGSLRQTTLSLATRGNLTFTPTLTLQLYAEPFVSSGRYPAVRRVTAPRAAREADRFEPIGAERLTRGDGRLRVDVDRDGLPDLDIAEPDFTTLSFRSNLVARWEYRPGSALMVVWQQQREAERESGEFRVGRGLDELFSVPARNVLLVKVSHWLSLR